MSRNCAVGLAMVGQLEIAGCGSPESAAADDPRITVADLLPVASDFRAGTQVELLDRDDQMILNLNIHTPSDGIGSDMNPVFDPAACADESRYADLARAGLIENGLASAVYFEDGGGYFVLVSETETDVARAAEAHTGACSSYTVTASSFDSTSQRRISTERLELPPALADADAAILSEVSHPDNPKWSDTLVLLGYAAVGKYTIVQVGYENADVTQSEFNDVFTVAVEKVRRLS